MFSCCLNYHKPTLSIIQYEILSLYMWFAANVAYNYQRLRHQTKSGGLIFTAMHEFDSIKMVQKI